MLAPGLQAADGLAAAADEVHRLVLVSSSIDCVSCSMSVFACVSSCMSVCVCGCVSCSMSVHVRELQYECVRVCELQHECVRVRE